jgi:hypothetical protein
MLEINANELMNRFRQPGGSDWVGLVNNVLWAACWQVGIPESEVRTCLRTEIPDGGVDTRVSQGSSSGDMTGYLADPSIWQFKAANEASLTIPALKTEVSKPYAKERIMANDAYRLCICAQIPDDRKTKLEAALLKAVAKINQSAPPPKILTVDDVARVAGRFPNFLHEYHGIEFQSGIYTFNSWSVNAEAQTRKFIPNAAFAGLSQRIHDHVDLRNNVTDPVTVIYGLAGIGKTRSIYEALKMLNASRGLTFYADNDQEALRIVRVLANTARTGGILVVDDCSVVARYELTQALAGHKNRMRVIAIQHDSEEGRSAAPELQMTPYSDKEIETVMRENYPGIPPERLRAYVQLAEGYLRLAIGLCELDHEIGQAQGIAPVVPSTGAYYSRRLGSDTNYVDALALFTRVGRDGDVSDELDALCKLMDFKRPAFEQRCAELKDSPGFVQRSAVYYRISPEIIAIHAFDVAWNKWSNGREQQFLTGIQSLPEAMQKSFMTRVSKSAKAEVREIVRNFFQSFAQRLSGLDLASIDKVLQIIALIEVEPDHYFPVLRRLVESASNKELVTERPVQFGWGPRRQLVFVADKMAQFATFFEDAERILFRLSQAETEPNIGNNASHTWKRLFRPLLSGTPISFSNRLALLRKRLPKPEQTLTPQFEGALEKTFDLHGTRTMSSAIVAGRIPDPEWNFHNQAEVTEWADLCLSLLFETAQSRMHATDSVKTYRLLTNAISVFVRQGFLDEVRKTIRTEELPESVQADLHAQLNLFVSRTGAFRGIPEVLLRDNYADKVGTWLATFEPKSLLGRIIEEVSSSYVGAGDDQEWLQRLAILAAELLSLSSATSPEFQAVMDWLFNEGARGAFNFGFQVGRLDVPCGLLESSVANAVARDQLEFARGYLAGCASTNALEAGRLFGILNRVETDHPRIAFYLAHAVADLSDVFGRTLSMVERRQLTPTYLQNFTVWIGTRKTSQEDAERALKILMPFVEAREVGCADIAIEFVAYQYNREGDADWKPSASDHFDQLSWEVVEAAIHDDRLHGYWWGKTVESLQTTSDPIRVARLLVRTMCGDNFHLRQEADRMLSSLAESSPQAVMNALGEMMLDEAMRWHFHIERFSAFLSLPSEAIDHWLNENGVEGALSIARHVPSPFLDDDKKPVLPPLTELFLGKYANDDRVFHEFAGGLHSLQSYKGDIANLKEAEAEVARKFLNHDLPRVRDWATYEVASATKEAADFRALLDKQRN